MTCKDWLVGRKRKVLFFVRMWMRNDASLGKIKSLFCPYLGTNFVGSLSSDIDYYLQSSFFFFLSKWSISQNLSGIWFVYQRLICHYSSLHFQNRGSRSKKLKFGKALLWFFPFPSLLPHFLKEVILVCLPLEKRLILFHSSGSV
jgi:hypothetical protein